MKFSKFKNKLDSTKYVLNNSQKKNIKGGNGNSDDSDSTNIGTVDTADI